MLIDLRVAQLLCSRLCHDLLGPVGSVNAGLELLAEGARKRVEMAEPLGLARESARATSSRLSFYRTAFGLGAPAGETPVLDQARELARDLLADGKVTLDWPDAVDGDLPLPAVGVKLLLNLVLLGIDSLPRGGTLAVRVARLPEGIGVAITAAGRGARLRDDLMAAMAPDVPLDRLSARNVHGHFAQRLADSVGGVVEVANAARDEVRLAVLVPAPAGA